MPRYVVLTHDHPEWHWDFLLEADNHLRSWRIAQSPDRESVGLLATPLPAHRLLYLEYEGPVSGNRGTVTRWDAGAYHILEETAVSLRVEVQGTRLHGCVELLQTADTAGEYRYFPARDRGEVWQGSSSASPQNDSRPPTTM